jgi:hypothetical protein
MKNPIEVVRTFCAAWSDNTATAELTLTARAPAPTLRAASRRLRRRARGPLEPPLARRLSGPPPPCDAFTGASGSTRHRRPHCTPPRSTST